MPPTPDDRPGDAPPTWRGGQLAALLVLPAAVFLWLTCVRLDAQGLYYDELHQATGAFTYLGSPPEYFSRAPVHGIPLLNMPYSGAIKTAAYGLYLRLVDPQFRVVSWRLVGVLFVTMGLAAFVWLARPGLAAAPAAVVLGLLLTDPTVLLAVRHDWGPIALALALRLVLIATWLHGEGPHPPSIRSSFALGFLVGLMTFEKLSSVVMLIALGAILLAGRRRTRRHLVAALGGVAIGALPLVLLNVSSLVTQGALISLSHRAPIPDRSWLTLLDHARGYAGLGAGDHVRRFILGDAAPAAVRAAEPWLLTLAVLLAAAVALARRRQPGARAAVAAVASYVGIGIALYLFPRKTGVHHWVLGTPFQYVAIGMALASCRRAVAAAPADRNRAGLLLTLVVGLLLIVRLAGVLSLEHALRRGAAGHAWDPSLTQLGRFAAERADDALFVAADWGVATQMYCLSNGRPGVVHELFWSYAGPPDLLRLQQQSGKDVLYAVALNPVSSVRPATTERIFRDLAGSPDWQEVPVDPEAAGFPAVTVRKFRTVRPP